MKRRRKNLKLEKKEIEKKYNDIIDDTVCVCVYIHYLGSLWPNVCK